MPSVLPEVFIPIHSLLPLKPDVNKLPTLRALAAADLDGIPPIETVLYDEDSEHPTHLIADGHHRAFDAGKRGLEVVRGVVASEDEHLALLGATAVRDCFSIQAFCTRYRREWRPHASSLGVTGVLELMYPIEVGGLYPNP